MATSTGQQVKPGCLVWLLFGPIMLVTVLFIRVIFEVAAWLIKVAIWTALTIQTLWIAWREKRADAS